MTTHRIHHEDNFTILGNEMLRDSRLSFRARGVLAMVLTHDDGWSATSEWISSQGKEGRDAVRAALAELDALGYRTVTKVQQKDGTWSTEVHWQTAPGPGNPAAGSPGAGEPGSNRRTPTEELTPTPRERGDRGLTSRSEALAVACPSCEAGPGESCQGTRHERSSCHLERHHAAGRPRNASQPDTLPMLVAVADGGPDPFEEFWKVYPRKAGKGSARRAWAQAVTRADPLTIIAGLRRNRQALAANEMRYIPHPATWLNGDRWLDQAGVPPSRAEGGWLAGGVPRNVGW